MSEAEAAGSGPRHSAASLLRPAEPRATLAGLGAAALWSLLGVLTAATGRLPPFQLLFLTFGIAGLLGLVAIARRPGGLAALRQKPHIWALGLFGLFGYHALYFAALKLAPPAEANLVNYLWPLLIVLFSGALPGERLRKVQIFGALLGFAGVVVLAGDRLGGGLRAQDLAGYSLAFAAAFVWASYSVLSRLVSQVPTETVAGFCLATSALGLLCHLAFETWLWPEGWMAWAAIALSGLGPVGSAFFLWDRGMKRGDIRLLAIASYAIPVVSTLILIATGYASPTYALALSCGLIAAGAALGSRKGGA